MDLGASKLSHLPEFSRAEVVLLATRDGKRLALDRDALAWAAAGAPDDAKGRVRAWFPIDTLEPAHALSKPARAHLGFSGAEWEERTFDVSRSEARDELRERLVSLDVLVRDEPSSPREGGASRAEPRPTEPGSPEPVPSAPAPETSLTTTPSSLGAPRSETVSAQAPGAPVLLVGATPGAATTGILYLASFLRRHGIEAFCRVQDDASTRGLLEADIKALLARYRPRTLGVSMKWFPHMARGLEICRIAKGEDPGLQVVLGGDTASYFARELVQRPEVDWVIRGDGEGPLLDLVRGEAPRNGVTKRQNDVVNRPITYAHRSKTNEDFEFGEVERVLVDPADLWRLPYVYVCTGKGCSLSCFYCAAARPNQVEVFGRKRPVLRQPEAVRADIERVRCHTSTLMFDFDLPNWGTVERYRRFFEGIDLTKHFVHFYSWVLPSDSVIELLSSTFLHVDLFVDMASLSEAHRLRLTEMRGPSGERIVKPQPTDAEVWALFERTERRANVRLTLNLIAGMPFFDDVDFAASEAMVDRLRGRFRCFRGLEWGRLHAQPGAPITSNYAFYGMKQGATLFEHFLEVSQTNLDTEPYPDMATCHYPFVLYRDDRLVGRTSQHYFSVSDRLRVVP